MTGTPDDDAISAARDLTGALKDMRDELAAVRKAAHTNRRIVIALVVAFCLLALGAVGFARNTIRMDDAQNASHASLISACQQANTNRTQDVAIWDTLLADLAPPAARTPAVKAKLAVIEREIKVKDELRDCNSLYAK